MRLWELKRQGSARGFTLVELLVVICIILVLAGLLFPALVYAQRLVRVRKARSEAGDLSKAWQTYWDAYTNWPFAAAFDMKDTQVAVLAGRDAANNPNNLKLMIFSSQEEQNGFKDPWKELYRIEYESKSITRDQSYVTRAYMGNRMRYAESK
jgi:prepilin-type N-terminal cleavage/methylation domain-containing protein